MYIHEYQAKNLLQRYGILVPPYAIASTEKEVIRAIRELELNEAVIKIQVHAGGRGKAGGVKFAKNSEEIVEFSKKMIGMRIINNQTGPHGIVGEKVLITVPVNIAKEYYLAATIDRERAIPILIASKEGGVEIEEIAEKSPEKILKVPICLTGKIRSYHLLEVAKFLGWEGDVRRQGMELISHVAQAFIETDGSLLEINPLVLSKEGKLYALDAKFSV